MVELGQIMPCVVERNFNLFKRYDYETIFYTLLRAADEAVAKTRKKWTPSIGIITI